MNSFSKTGLVSLTIGLLVSSALGQHPTHKPRTKQSDADWASFSKLLDRAMKKVDAAVVFERKKRYAIAEATCQEALDILEPAPFARGPVNEALAHIYLSEGLYDEAVKILKPMYEPQNTNVETASMLAIACCHTSRLTQAVDIMRALYSHEQVGLWFIDEVGLPMSSEVTRDSVEATAYLIWGETQPGTAEHPDGIERLETAIRLAPRCGAAYYSLARWRRILFEPNAIRVSEGLADIYRRAWKYGDPLLRKKDYYPRELAL